MATTKVSGELVDLRGGLPDFSLAATNTVSYLNAGGGNQYNFNGAYGLYGVVNGTFVLSSVSSSHPIAILNNGKTSLISYTGAVNEGSQTGPDGNTYTYYSGDVTITVSGNFDVVSYACKVHGYMGGQNNLIYTNLHSDLGLKIPTGTNANRPATDVAGMVRNNTNETSDSSASCEEYYNGTAWKKINNVVLPVYFKPVLYTGNSTNDFSTNLEQSITGLGFKPDFVWIKGREDYSNGLFDSTRGGTFQLQSNTTAAQNSSAGYLKTFDSDGFGLGGDFAFNRNAYTYVAWCWQANGGTTSSNTDGTLTSTVQANTGLGFSIVKYTGVANGSAKSFGHGLGVVPDMVIIKDIDWAVPSWFVWHKDLAGGDYFLRLESTNAQAQSSGIYSSAPTSSVVNIGNDSGVGDRTDNYIAYCFNSVAGYSKFGTYAGSASNVDVVTGFQPSFVLVRSTGVEDWNIMDSARGGSERLFPNTNGAESTTANACIFNSDGFTIGVTGNASLNNAGDNYIYMAFK